MKSYIKGMDISTLYEIEKYGAKYYDNGIEKDLLEILQSYGANGIRLRLWNNPYSETGEAYGAGTNDLATTIHLSKRAKARGMDILLDFHYSDFWTDPGKQIIPKAWKDFSVEQLEIEVYEYTKEVLQVLEENDVFPDLIQVGNELSNGLLWPYGKVPEYDNITKFINAGIRGVRAVNKQVPIMLHLDNGGKNELYREWFDEFLKRGEEFQIIGLSYYPFWHGSIEELATNMNDLALRYKKDLIVAEVSMGFTMEDYAEYEKLSPEERKGMATKPHLVEKLNYKMTKEGQCKFIEDVLKVIEEVPEHRGKGFFYWEPGWLPVPKCEWASKSARAYVGDPGAGGNEWANQALFDYEGNVLPSLKVIKDYKPKG